MSRLVAYIVRWHYAEQEQRSTRVEARDGAEACHLALDRFGRADLLALAPGVTLRAHRLGPLGTPAADSDLTVGVEAILHLGRAWGDKGGHQGMENQGTKAPRHQGIKGGTEQGTQATDRLDALVPGCLDASPKEIA